MKVACIAIAKMEELYIVDWIEHNKKIGIDKIYLADNNDVNYHTPLKPIIQKYIDTGYVEYINYVGFKERSLQSRYYTKQYTKIKNDFDWITFIDIDEYIMIKKYTDIKHMLSDHIFDSFNSICLLWKNFGDSNNVYYVNKPVEERFTDWSTSVTMKTIIRGHLDIKINSAHDPKNNEYNINKIFRCDVLGNKRNYEGPVTSYDKCTVQKYYDIAYINHYITKSTEEYIKYKMNRGTADYKFFDEYSYRFTKEWYYRFNKETYEKDMLFKQNKETYEKLLAEFIEINKNLK